MFQIPGSYSDKVDYLASITEAEYSFNGGAPQKVLRSSTDMTIITDIRIWGAGGTAVYTFSGIYVWTIRATGYADAIITVTIL